MSVGRPRWTWRSTCSIACWTWDARPTSALRDLGRGWAQCGRAPDPCTTLVGALVEGWRAQAGVLVLVTHQVNITALTGLYPAEGEILVLRPRATAGFDLVARFRP